MDTIAILRKACELVTYKPGCQFSIADQDDQIEIVMSRMAPDIRAPTEVATIRFTTLIDKKSISIRSEVDVEDIFYRVIRDAEMHEVDEWFRFRGKCVHDPHPENKGMPHDPGVT